MEVFVNLGITTLNVLIIWGAVIHMPHSFEKLKKATGMGDNATIVVSWLVLMAISFLAKDVIVQGPVTQAVGALLQSIISGI